MEIGDILYIYMVRKVGGVKCQLFLKRYNHWEWALKMIFMGSGCIQFPEAVVASTAKESLLSTERGSLQVICFIGVETAEYNCNKFR